MKLCIIGNSHIACLKQAYEELKANLTDLDISFFGAIANNLLHTKTDQFKRLRPLNRKVREQFSLTSQGAEYIELELFDAIIIHPGVTNLTHIQMGNKKRQIFYSKQVRDISLNNIIEQSLGTHLIKQIRKCSDIPIYLSSAPLLAPIKQPQLGDEEDYSKLVNYLKKVFHNRGAQFLEQSKETISNVFYTHNHYTKDSVKLVNENEKHVAQDVRHMDKDFGKIYLTNLILKLTMLETA